MKETAAILLSFLLGTVPGHPSDDFTDDFHISATKEKAEIPDKNRYFRGFLFAWNIVRTFSQLQLFVFCPAEMFLYFMKPHFKILPVFLNNVLQDQSCKY